jgi:hypothetical protein
MLEVDADLVARREGILLITDKDFASKPLAVRVTQRVLAMAAGIWHNNLIGAPVTRSLIAYDHCPFGTIRLGVDGSGTASHGKGVVRGGL